MKLMHKEVLPTWEDGRFKGKVRWKESIGYVVPFECNNIRGEVEILDYANRKLLLKYKDNKQWVTEVSFNKCHIEHLLGLKHKGFKCKKGEVIDVKTGNKIKILEVFYRERESKGKIKKDKYVEYKCLTCGNIDISREDWVLKGESNICNVCCNPPKKAMKGYNDISTTHSHLVKYFKNIDDAYTHTYNSERPVVFKCPKCGNEQDIILSNVTGRFRKGYECNQCGSNTSYPERFTSSLLNFRNVKFKRQLSRTTFGWCGGYRYDFYLPEHDMIIEIHGYQHGKFIKSGELTLVKRTNGFSMSDRDDIKIDAEKCWQAYKNGIKEYVTISCYYSNSSFILNNMKSSILSNYIDLNLTNDDVISVENKTRSAD